MYIIKTLFLLLILPVSTLSYPNENKNIIVLQSELTPLNLNKYTYAYTTRDTGLDIKDVLKKEFRHMPSGLNTGLNDKVFWVKYNFENPSKSIEDYYIFFPYNHINKINVYLISNNTTEHIDSLGIFYSKYNKDLPSYGYPVLIKFNPGFSTVVMEIEHLYLPLRGNAFLMKKSQVLDNTLQSKAYFSMWKGFLIMVLLLTSVLFFSLRNRSFLYYFLMNLGVFLFINAEIGDLFIYLERDILNNTTDIKRFANVLIIIFSPLFINEIISISKINPVIWKTMTYGSYPAPLLWIICLFPQVKQTYLLYYSSIYFIVFTAIVLVLTLFLSFQAYRKKHKNALPVVIIYSFYLIIIFANVIFPNLGLADNSIMVYNTLILGSVLEALTFFLIIGKEVITVFKHRAVLIEEQKNHQTEMLKAVIDSQEKERNRVGRELHDMIGANISLIKQKIDKSNIPLLELVNGTIKSVRNLSHGLITPLIKNNEFADEINDLCNLFSGYGINIENHFHNWPKTNNENNSTHFYRIIQELLQNAIKHSFAKNVLIQFIGDKNGGITIMYEDDGIGFDFESNFNVGGVGLLNIENRIKSMNASIVYDTLNNRRGTTIVIRKP